MKIVPTLPVHARQADPDTWNDFTAQKGGVDGLNRDRPISSAPWPLLNGRAARLRPCLRIMSSSALCRPVVALSLGDFDTKSVCATGASINPSHVAARRLLIGNGGGRLISWVNVAAQASHRDRPKQTTVSCIHHRPTAGEPTMKLQANRSLRGFKAIRESCRCDLELSACLSAPPCLPAPSCSSYPLAPWTRWGLAGLGP